MLEHLKMLGKAKVNNLTKQIFDNNSDNYMRC